MEKQRVNMDIDKNLWREVSVMAVKMAIEKRLFVEAALREKIEKESKK